MYGRGPRLTCQIPRYQWYEYLEVKIPLEPSKTKQQASFIILNLTAFVEVFLTPSPKPQTLSPQP